MVKVMRLTALVRVQAGISSCIVLYCVNSTSGLKQEDDIIYYAKNIEIRSISTYVVPGATYSELKILMWGVKVE